MLVKSYFLCPCFAVVNMLYSKKVWKLSNERLRTYVNRFAYGMRVVHSRRGCGKPCG